MLKATKKSIRRDYSVRINLYFVTIFVSISVNWFRREYGRTDSADSHESSESPTDGSFVRQPSFHYGHYRSASRSGRG